MLSTINHTRRYIARVTNMSTNTDLSDYIDSIDISMPHLSEISTMTAKFQTDEALAVKGNEILIEVLDEVGNTIYSLSGEATVTNVEHNYTGRSKYSYEVKEEYTRLFERVIAKTEVFFDLYVCNNADKANSLMHIIGQKLGFKEFDFRDYLERVPFIIFNEGDRWIDELQSLIAATGSIIYVFNKKLVFRPCNFNLNRFLLFNDRNIITNISKRFKGQNTNGTKVLYDRFERLDNQVVFNLASKVIVDENTGLDKEVQAMRINYITSSVANPTITRASGYYFTTDSPDSRVDVELKRGSDYIIKEMKSTGLIVKFYNARPHKLYIDNFEIKGMPLVKYTDNSAVVKDSNITNEAEENFRKLNKNKYIQTLKQAEYLCNAEYIRGKSEYTYEFDTQFIREGLNLGEVYNLEIKGINTLIELESYSIHLKPSDFRIKVRGRQVELDVQVKQSNTDSLNSDTQFVDLKPLEEKIEDNTNAVKQVTQKVKSKLHVGETEPSENVEEYDVWLKESDGVFKTFLNGRWSQTSEKDLLPAIKHYNSLRKAELNIGKVNDRAGLFLLNDDEKFGAINGALAEVSIDKKGTVKMANVNNLLEWNVKDPSQPNKVKSKLYMGVTDVSKIPENVYFKIGDDSNGFSLEFKEGEKGVAKIDGADIGESLGTVERALQEGNFTVTGNTVFDGDASFISRGTDERISIRGGSIDFYRTVDGREQRLTRIKNIRYGTVHTDSKGKGIVDFEGFKQPMLILPSVKSANFGKNMASIFCYAEHIEKTKYRFYVGGTNEDYRVNKAVKYISKEVVLNDVTQFELLGFGIKLNTPNLDDCPAIDKLAEKGWTPFKQYKKDRRVSETNFEHEIGVKEGNIQAVEEFSWRIDVVLVNGASTTILTSRTLSMSNCDLYMGGDYKNFNEWLYYHGEWVTPANQHKRNRQKKASKEFRKNIDVQLSMLKKFKTRTNIVLKIEITILKSGCHIRAFKRRRGHGKDPDDEVYCLDKVYQNVISLGNFVAPYLVVNSEKSTISDVTGEGEVQYIAMEVD